MYTCPHKCTLWWCLETEVKGQGHEASDTKCVINDERMAIFTIFRLDGNVITGNATCPELDTAVKRSEIKIRNRNGRS